MDRAVELGYLIHYGQTRVNGLKLQMDEWAERVQAWEQELHPPDTNSGSIASYFRNGQ